MQFYLHLELSKILSLIVTLGITLSNQVSHTNDNSRLFVVLGNINLGNLYGSMHSKSINKKKKKRFISTFDLVTFHMCKQVRFLREALSTILA